jgi:hypothetical protein
MYRGVIALMLVVTRVAGLLSSNQGRSCRFAHDLEKRR